MLPIILLFVVGSAGLAGGILFIVRADRIVAPVLDTLGAWATPALRGVGMLMILVGGIFVVIGMLNVFSIA